MSDFWILGTDTDAGKTTFALLWLTAFLESYEYWKPVETGLSDTERVLDLVPGAAVHAPCQRFRQAVAPLLAARGEQCTVETAAILAAAKPAPFRPGRRLLLETFGSPFSPLNDAELQIELIRKVPLPAVLISSAALGAIGRTLQCLQALEVHGLRPSAVVLVGEPDAFAVEQIAQHWPGGRVFSLQPPQTWDLEGIRHAAEQQRQTLTAMECHLAGQPARMPSDLVERDRRSVWHPYTSLREPDAPLVVTAAEDEFLHLADGRRVIDGISSWWTILHGHRYPPLMAALRQAAADLDHVHFAGVTHRHAVRLAELLLASAPWTGGRVFFSDNGSTAVEVALKMAYQFWCHHGEPQRTLFVGFEGGYHGDTFGAMAAGRDPVFFGTFEPLLFKTAIVPLSPDRLDETLTRQRGTVAAVIIEPLVQGAGGMRMHSPEELRQLAEIARKHGVLFIADEVMTCGRVAPFWAHREAAIAPDLVCAAKTLTGGVLPLAATLAAPHVVAAWDTEDRRRTFFHGHSFTAHPLACAVAVANWELLTAAPNPIPTRLEAFWKEALRDLNGHPRVRALRVRGSIAAVEVEANGGYLAEVGRKLRLCCLEQGVLLRPLGSVLYTMPPYCTSITSLHRIAAAFRAAVESLD